MYLKINVRHQLFVGFEHVAGYIKPALQLKGSGADGRETEEDITHRIKAGWLKGETLSTRTLSTKPKGKFYRMLIRPAMLHGSACWVVK